MTHQSFGLHPDLLSDRHCLVASFRGARGNRALKERFPHHVTHLVYENTVHWVRWQHPQRLLRDVLAFVETVR